MLFIIGLGNPGEKYNNTRHNVGFIFLDRLIKSQEFINFYQTKPQLFDKIQANTKLNVKIIKIGKTIIAEPQTFMNNSGKAVKDLINYYAKKIQHHKMLPYKLIVIHDDIDIELGKYKIQKNRNSAGHLGVQSVINELKTKNFIRIRIGIKNFLNHKKPDINSYVLSDFTKEEKEILNKVINEAIKSLFDNIQIY